MMPNLNVAVSLHLVNNSIQTKEAALSQTITKKNDVYKVDASNLGVQVTQQRMYTGSNHALWQYY